MTFNLNSPRWFNIIKTLIRCSTNLVPQPCKNTFHLIYISFCRFCRFINGYIGKPSPHNLLTASMMLTSKPTFWRWAKQDFKLCFKSKFFCITFILRLLWEIHQPKQIYQEERETINVEVTIFKLFSHLKVTSSPLHKAA